MTFFPPDPEMPEPDEADSPQPSWWRAPEDELPVVLSVSIVLAVSEHVAIALVGIAVYGEGVQLRVQRRLRRHGLPRREWGEMCGAFMEHMPYDGQFESSGRLRFGVVLVDGEGCE